MDKKKLNVGQVLILRNGDKREDVEILSIGQKYLFISGGRRVNISNGGTNSHRGTGAWCGKCYATDDEYDCEMIASAWMMLRHRVGHSNNCNAPKGLTLANIHEAEKLLFGGA